MVYHLDKADAPATVPSECCTPNNAGVRHAKGVIDHESILHRPNITCNGFG